MSTTCTPCSRSFIERIRRPASYTIGFLLIALIILTKPHHFGQGVYKLIELGGYLLIFLAVIGRIWSIFFIGGRKNRELCQDGPYAYCRNPLYFFSFLGVAGIGLCAQSLPALLIVAPAFLIYYRFMIRAEERRMLGLFGEAFTRYASQVPRFWPRWRTFSLPKEVTVNARAFSRSLAEVMCFLLAIIAIEGLQQVKMGGYLPVLELPW